MVMRDDDEEGRGESMTRRTVIMMKHAKGNERRIETKVHVCGVFRPAE